MQTTSLVALIFGVSLGQVDDPRRLHPIIKEQAQAYARLWVAHQAEPLAKLADVKLVEAYGGRVKLMAALQQSFERFQNQGNRITLHEVGNPTQLINVGREWFAVVPFNLRLAVTEGTGELQAWLLAVSADNGGTWTLHDGHHLDRAKLQAAWPKLPPDLKLPAAPKVAILQRDGKRKVYAANAGNYKTAHAASWNVTKQDGRDLTLAHGPESILIYATETGLSIEDVVSNVEQQYRRDPRFAKTIYRKELKVAGEPAMQWLFDEKNNAGLHHLTVFTHQGIEYRVVGLQEPENNPEFEREYNNVLERFAFLRDRVEWLRKTEGKPMRTALAGGLAFFDALRPRWTEITFDEQNYNPDWLDHVAYQLYTKGAWFDLRVLESRGDAAAELDDLETLLRTNVLLPKVQRKTLAVAGRTLPMVEVTGTFNGHKYLRRGVVFLRDGVTVQAQCDCYAAQESLTQTDWESLLASVVLQAHAKPEQPFAFAPKNVFADQRAPDPALAVFLPKAQLLYPWPRSNDLRGVSANGQWAFLQTPQGDFVENLQTRQRTPLGSQLPMGSFAGAVSDDGQFVAVTEGRQISVQSQKLPLASKIPGNAVGMAFSRKGQELFLAYQDPLPRDPSYDASVGPTRYNLSRLERLNLQTGKRDTLLDFPLGRVQFPAFAPDGKRLALVTNRDFPRTRLGGGHLYLLNTDGANLQQLTKEPAQFTSVVWSDDGKSLYVVCRPETNHNNLFSYNIGANDGFDLCRVDAKTGVTVNLTRSGSIGRVWHAGTTVLFDIQSYRVANHQQGCYRIAPEELAKLTAGRPLKTLSPNNDATPALTAAVRQVVGPTPPRDLIPSADLMMKAADAFAAAAREHLGAGFDFSRESLHLLDRLSDFNAPVRLEGLVHLGVAAYYGETLRRVAGAEWHIQPLPLGEWTPGRFFPDNALVRVVMPFSETITPNRTLLPEALPRLASQKMILVYPPSHAPAAVKKATGPAYFQAQALIDAGKIDEALAIFVQELAKQPKNVALAREAIGLCEACRKPEMAEKLTQQAIAAGSQVPDLLMRHADLVAKSDPKQALALYRQAAQGQYPTVPLLLKLARAYTAAGQPAFADTCYRRAYQPATDDERREIRRQLGMGPLLGPQLFGDKQLRD